jgi:lipid-A-disaccharide synthase
MSAGGKPLRVFIVAGEESGDILGAGLIQALRARVGALEVAGVGGAAMAREGVQSIFTQSDIALMGFIAVIKGLPTVLARLKQTSEAALAFRPDVLVIIDSPDFTHRVARRVRKAAPETLIINYVSPSVWAWRPGRAPKMRAYIDHVLALLPFEPDALARLRGPAATFDGHPLAAKADELRPNAEESARRAASPPVLLVLPGSRRSEVSRLLEPFGAALAQLAELRLEIIIPTVPHVEGIVREGVRGWTTQPRIITALAEKRAAFRIARAALAASGTVTLELALAGVPTVAAYRLAAIEAAIARRLIKVPSVILANLVLGENVMPEFLQEACTPDALAGALRQVLHDSPQRQAQLAAFARLDHVMEIGTAFPSERAADVVVSLVRQRQP